MKTPNHKLASAIAVALSTQLGSLTTQAAELQPGDILTISTGVSNLDAYGESLNVASGSWFGMDTNSDSKIQGTEQTAVTGLNGITIGSTQEPDIIDAWSFFGPAGTHYTTVAPTGDTDDGINFSGWTVFWNGSSIPMGTNAWTPGNCGAPWMGCDGLTFANGVAVLSWSGVYGDTYSLWYSAIVPSGTFENVKYVLYLTGIVESGSIPPEVSAGALDDGGKGGAAANAFQIRDLAAAGIPEDTGYATGRVFDFSVTGLGAGDTVDVVLTTGAIPENATYRKYTDAAGWFTFVEDANNLVKSAARVGGVCPAPSDAAYEDGLVAGHNCVQLTIEDGGPNDADLTADGTVVDPGAVARPLVEAAPPDLTSSTSGCTLATGPVSITKAGDWMLIGGLLAALGLYRRRRVS